ncbi:MAG: 30S ribosomal protein S20 [Patescibacteria group bacterium]|nr:30S ribosomal protein S20 [Patescibacteria group bacterium]MDE1945705.1 30S ribosomal protein S20 [Patescibacteria group bacterium]
MPITSSAKKALRVARRKGIFNAKRETAIDRETRLIKKLVKEGKAKDAAAALPQAYQAIDKAVKVKFWKKNTAARAKSKLARLVNSVKGKK